MAEQYNDPIGGTDSSIGSQIRTDHYQKQALIEARKETYFMPLADVTSMPKHMGKKIRKYHYLPLLDDANINDQGIDAAGVVISPGSGNLYGSSKDPGVISGKLPALDENGGRKNRVGHTRVEVEGSINKFGFFSEYTQESVDFDTDADKQMHINREMINGAMEMTEDALQIDLLNAAGVEYFADAATADIQVGASSSATGHDLVTYADLLKLHITLNQNRTPMQTKVFTGTRLVDTVTISGGRVMYVGSELQHTLEAMTDLHGNPAFIPVQKYAAGAATLQGEIGSVGHFRIVVVPEMLSWAGAGAPSPDAEYYGDTSYDIFPMLVVGAESFTTIGFQTDGKTVKFKIYSKAPGEATADKTDPFGEQGFMSIKWYYGTLIQRPERIGLIKTAALV
jgi:N4-gp56 family major capsid protein